MTKKKDNKTADQKSMEKFGTTSKFKIAFCMGLQRTGTNWISSLVRENFEVRVVGNVFWKHLTPLNVKQPYHKMLHFGKEDAFVYKNIKIGQDVFYLMTSKDYDLWLESIDRKAADVYMTHNGINGRNDLPVLYDVWMSMKDKILRDSPDNTFYRRYEDWYVNWKEYLEEIEQITGWKRKHKEFVNPKTVHMSQDSYNPDNYKHLTK